MELHIEHIGGFCPVQAEGIIDGVPFYFRARWAHWTMSIGDDPVGIHLGKPGWIKRVRYGEPPSAGWMSLKIAEAIIRECAEAFLVEKELVKKPETCYLTGPEERLRLPKPEV